jgi:hypothetical protein
MQFIKQFFTLLFSGAFAKENATNRVSEAKNFGTFVACRLELVVCLPDQ